MSRSERSLLHDDALVVRADAAVERLVVPWLPLHAAPPRAGTDAAVIDVVAEPEPERHEMAGDTLLRFDGVRALEQRDADAVHFVGTAGVRGGVALDAKRARIRVPHADDRGAGGDVYSMLTLASAFLIGRLGGALVHAGGVVDPDGRAWLLVGDTHAGKTTTCVSLVDAGWRWLADDQVVLRFVGENAVDVQGWPRRAHLDEGWSDARVTGTRGTVDLRDRWADRWLARAPLAGVLLPSVRAEERTSASAASSASAFAALVRQSPWLMADRGAAAAVTALLRAAASRPALALALGRDGYARGDVLVERLGSAVSESARD